jgi:flagellar protein FlgJ
MAIRTPTDAAGPAFDARALDGLRQQARNDPKAAVAKAAGEFEALFLQMVLKQMRDALPQDGPLASDTTRTYTALFDQQIAQTLGRRGVGLRKALEQQLARSLPAAAGDAPATSGAAPASVAPPPAPLRGAERKQAVTDSAPSAGSSSTTQTTAAATGDKRVPGVVQAFVDRMRPAAEAAAATLGIPAHLLLAQAGLETGWGKSLPGGGSNNLFGIKAQGRYAGASVMAATTEYVNGVASRVVERFRSYASIADSFRDFGSLLQRSPRYREALANVDQPAAYARSLQQAGYATDPRYAEKLTRAIALVNRQLAAADDPQVLARNADSKLTKV